MIGVRYRDLIESADKIVNMHSAALRLEGSLKEMPDKWRRIEAALTTTLAEASRMAMSSQDRAMKSAIEVPLSKGATVVTYSDSSIHDRVQFLVAVPEEMWQLLDRGESFRALQLYMAASNVHSNPQFQQHASKFPFVPPAWSCIQSFRPVRSLYFPCLTDDSVALADRKMDLFIVWTV